MRVDGGMFGANPRRVSPPWDVFRSVVVDCGKRSDEAGEGGDGGPAPPSRSGPARLKLTSPVHLLLEPGGWSR